MKTNNTKQTQNNQTQNYKTQTSVKINHKTNKNYLENNYNKTKTIKNETTSTSRK